MPLTVDGESRFKVVDRGLGRVALQTDKGCVSVDETPDPGTVTLRTGTPSEAETFQWTENVFGDLNLLSLVTHRYLRLDEGSASVVADSPGPKPDRREGTCLVWQAVTP